MEKKWYQQNWAIVLLLIFYFPVGLYLMWKSDWASSTKKKIVVFYIMFFVVAAVVPKPDNSNQAPAVISQEKAIEVMEKKLDSKLKNTYDTEESLTEFRNFIAKYKDCEIGDVCYDIYLNYLYKCDNRVDDYRLLGYSASLDMLQSMKQITYSDEQMEVLNQLEGILNAQLAISGDYPKVCYADEFEFSRHGVGYSLSAYPVWEEDSDVEGYQCIMFTDYERIYTGSGYTGVPMHKEYYLVYMPDNVTIKETIWKFENLFLVGYAEYRGKFTYNVPIYLNAAGDEFDNVLDYVYDMEARAEWRWAWTDTINAALGMEVSEDGVF